MSAAGDGPRRYGGVAMAFHWVSVVLVLALIATGAVMTRLTPGSVDQFALYQLHKAIGVSVLLLTIARIAWRFVALRPPSPPDLPRTTRAIAHGVHVGLYVLLLAVPLAGWALVSASTFNIPTSLFGIATWPHLPGLSDLDSASRARIEPVLSRIHVVLAYLISALILLHGTAALWHGRPIVARMLPGLSVRRAPR
jgi:cytochrome b561